MPKRSDFIKFKKLLIFILVLTVVFSFGFKNENTYAQSDRKVILGGDSIGLQLSTGVYITGKHDVICNDVATSPWLNSDIENGDIITSINKKTVKSIDDIVAIIKQSPCGKTPLEVSRNNSVIKTEIEIVKTDDGKSIGLYVKDSLLGVGTLTYVDPSLNQYGALGHAITNNRYLLNSGHLSPSTVNGVRKSIPGVAGEKKATLSLEPIGTIDINSDYGIFGNFSSDIKNESLISVGYQKDVKLGKAQIVTVIKGNEKEYFDIEIIEIKKQTEKDIKGIKFKVTDPVLLQKTGGIIQGMSGSPIIQNDKIIGAVSHVIVDNPLFGYGIYIEWMIATQIAMIR